MNILPYPTRLGRRWTRPYRIWLLSSLPSVVLEGLKTFETASFNFDRKPSNNIFFRLLKKNIKVDTLPYPTLWRADADRLNCYAF